LLKKELKLIRDTRSHLGERASYVILSDEGFSVKEIAIRLSRHEHTIRAWIKKYIAKGIQGLSSKKPPGRSKVKRLAVVKEVSNLLLKTPREYGYKEEGWTVCILLDYFSKKEIDVKEDTVRRALHETGWVYKRFAKKVPENAPSKEEKSQKIKELVEAIQNDKPDETLFVDEANFMTGPYVQRGWFKKGEKKAPCPAKRQSQTVFGALRLNGRLFWKKAERGTGDSFISFMRQLLQNIPKKKIAIILAFVQLRIAPQNPKTPII
jgi:transposase